jgi:hypothetical protein
MSASKCSCSYNNNQCRIFSVSRKVGADAKQVMKAFITRLGKTTPHARPLDSISEDTVLQGQTVPICIHRDDILATSTAEIIDADTRSLEPLDVRFPLEVSFYLERKCVHKLSVAFCPNIHRYTCKWNASMLCYFRNQINT